MPETSSKRAAVSPRLLAEEQRQAREKVARALRDYLGDPGEENTRLLRASARRLETLLKVVPKNSRSKGMRRTLDGCKKVLKTTSKVRDSDIIQDKLSRLPRDHMVELLLSNLGEEREAFVGDTMKSAWRLFEMEKNDPGRKDLRGAHRWVRRKLVELDGDVTRELGVVVRSEGKIEELHSLRKNAKTFRYVLELLPTTKGSARAVQVLRSWQDVLGEIRDSDTMIEYLGRARQHRAVKDAMAAERALRHNRYRSFVRSCSRDFRSGLSLLRLAGFRRETA